MMLQLTIEAQILTSRPSQVVKKKTCLNSDETISKSRFAKGVHTLRRTFCSHDKVNTLILSFLTFGKPSRVPLRHCKFPNDFLSDCMSYIY